MCDTNDPERHNTSDSPASQDPKSILVRRLRGVDVNTERFIPLQSGRKKAYEENWPDETQYELATLSSGNYGIVAGDGLLILDIDDYTEPVPPAIEEWIESHPTLVVRSPHRGTHHYYGVPETTAERFEQIFDVANPKLGVLDVCSDGSQTVGPGSEITECTKCDQCSPESPGRYVIETDRELSKPSEEDVNELICLIDDVRGNQPSASKKWDSPTQPIDGNGNGTDEFARQWIENAREWDDYLDRLCEWAEHGDKPEEYGFQYPDRSRNETALATKLLRRVGGFDDPQRTIRQLMDHYNPPKWSDAGESYQKSVIRSSKSYTIDAGEFYDPALTDQDQDQSTAPVVRHKAGVIIQAVPALLHDHAESGMFDDQFRTIELREKSFVPESINDRCIRRVLSDLEDFGYLTKERVGEHSYWREVHEVPMDGQEFERLKNEYRSKEDVQKQRHEWLRETDQ